MKRYFNFTGLFYNLFNELWRRHIPFFFITNSSPAQIRFCFSLIVYESRCSVNIKKGKKKKFNINVVFRFSFYFVAILMLCEWEKKEKEIFFFFFLEKVIMEIINFYNFYQDIKISNLISSTFEYRRQND